MGWCIVLPHLWDTDSVDEDLGKLSQEDRDAAAARFGKSLGRAIAARGISVKDLAERTGVSRNTIHRIKSGRLLPTIESVILLTTELGPWAGTILDDHLLDGATPPTDPREELGGLVAELGDRVTDQGSLFDRLLDVLAASGIDVDALRKRS
jgi:transcriptional regulator with XRE-family HTH domain